MTDEVTAKQPDGGAGRGTLPPGEPPGEGSEGAPARSGARRSGGVVLMQAVSSLSTVVQLGLFAILLPRAFFDDYSVWITSTMFVVGLGQAIGSERVVIGVRSRAEGRSSSWALGAAIAAVQAVVGAWLGSWELALCAVAVLAWAVWDYLRIVEGFDRASWFLKRDVGVLVGQVAATVGAWALDVPGHLLVLAWWGVGLLAWTAFVAQDRRPGTGRPLAGLAVVWADRRESAPLLLDAALAGVPLVLALALARSQGGVGDASAARMALTILGPVTVLGIAGRRIVYSARSTGALSPRARLLFTVAIGAVFAVCFAILALTRTPLYPLLLPGFGGLTWLAVAGFATNHSAVMAAMLPAADLRADRRSLEIGAARLTATLTALAFVWVFAPFDTVANVAWCVAVASIAYAVVLTVLAPLRRPRPTPVVAA
ncbi:hypothetical protein QWY28_11695 [Nocardioides sp. SOB77]|uniref:Uncharacterized protein n=1 Tax=Nocardioides oceani TaxID=3058369 RepID=A0ABT8FGS6_9ACTN|nr:hypothetical protein [Nocardioides oceani]MDN4173612.1 hypothetical protein [Nocardioides oceani]